MQSVLLFTVVNYAQYDYPYLSCSHQVCNANAICVEILLLIMNKLVIKIHFFHEDINLIYVNVFLGKFKRFWGSVKGG